MGGFGGEPADMGRGVGDELIKGEGIVVWVGPTETGAAFAGEEFESLVGADRAEGEDGAGPVAPFGGAGAEVGEVAGLPFGFFVAGGGFIGVVGDDGGAFMFMDEGIDAVTEEGADVGLGVGLAADEGKSGVDGEDVGVMRIEERGDDVEEERGAGVEIFFMDEDGGIGRGNRVWRDLEAVKDAVAHFGEVAVVVFGLDEERGEGFGGDDAESWEAERPEDEGLEEEGRFAGAGGADEEEAAAAAEEAVFKEFIGVLVGWGEEIGEGASGDGGGITIVGVGDEEVFSGAGDGVGGEGGIAGDFLDAGGVMDGGAAAGEFGEDVEVIGEVEIGRGLGGEIPDVIDEIVGVRVAVGGELVDEDLEVERSALLVEVFEGSEDGQVDGVVEEVGGKLGEELAGFGIGFVGEDAAQGAGLGLFVVRG